MKKFEFKLETVLRLKKRVEEERRQQLQQAQLRYQTACAAVEQCQAKLNQTMNNYCQSVQRKYDRFMANDYRQYLVWLEGKRELAENERHHCEAQVAEARQNLLEATRERKVLDKLREKAYQAYQAEELKIEIEFLDELGTGRFVRQETGN